MIPRAQFDAYNSTFNKLVAKEQDRVAKKISEAFIRLEHAPVAEKRDATIEILDAYTQTAQETSSALAAAWYDKLAKDFDFDAMPAITCATSASQTVSKTVRYQMKNIDSKQPDNGLFIRRCSDLVGDQMVRALNETVLANVKRDAKHGVRYARIPSGLNTCTFCIMLASGGARYLSRKTAGEDMKYHRNCRCKIVPSQSKDPMEPVIEGIDPKQLKTRWKQFEQIDALNLGTKQEITRKAIKLELMKSGVYGDIDSWRSQIPWLHVLDDYYISDDKINRYSLDRYGQERAQQKAKLFKATLGFDYSDGPELLRQAYVYLHENEQMLQAIPLDHERKRKDNFKVAGHEDRQTTVKVIWQKLDDIDDKLRLVTCYPIEDKRGRQHGGT